MSKIIYSKDGAVGRIVISNPKKFNAMNLEMWLTLPKALKELDADPEVRVIVVSGEGERAFISGADISEFDGLRDAQAAQDKFNAAVAGAYSAPSECQKPVIASIRGICFGGGLGFAAACDVRLCSEDAIFRMPAARLGLGYDPVGIKRFMDVIGLANTADIFYSARQFNAIEAQKMGFVSQIFANDQLESATNQYVQMVSENAPLTMAAAKFAMNEYLKPDAQRDYVRANELFEQCYTSSDYAEGRSAFAQKRTPVFTGK